MTHRIVWRQTAVDALDMLYDWIADQGDAATAYDYTSQIEAHVARLSTTPEWGALRETLGPGVRTIAYRRRTVIAYLVTANNVEILDVFHGGRLVTGTFDE